MTIDTKAVAGRRHLEFRSLDDVVADAEKLVSSGRVKILGNWPLNQLLMHEATAINDSIDGMNGKAPWYFRLIGPFLKRTILTKGLRAGFQLPKEREAASYPAASSDREALEKLRKAAARVKTERMTSPHPLLGELSHDEWMQLHLRHAELHQSFAVPE
jgi:Protein of unknown function (DUF1569)